MGLMSANSTIQWTDHTRNFWSGCTKVSPGCLHCYAESLAKRNTVTFGKWGKGAPRSWHGKAAREDLMKWNTRAAKARTTIRVFPNSMSDWLDDEVPVEWLAHMLDTIRITPNLIYQLLTKRPENFRPRLEKVLGIIPRTGLELDHAMLRTRIEIMLNGWAGYSYIAPEAGRENYWMGTTVEDQQRADERIPLLLDIPARVRFLSCEPLLGPVKIDHIRIGDNQWFPMQHLHWVITGGESGPKCRTANVDWFRSLRDQCGAAGVPYFLKQLGGVRDHRGQMSDFPEDLQIRQFPTP